MKTNTIALIVGLFVAQAAFAETQFGAKSGFKVHDVVLSETVKVSEPAVGKEVPKSFELKRVTQGLRRKYIAIITANVYVAQLFNTDPKTADLKSAEALRESLMKNLPVVVSMTFVRDVDIGKIVDGYKEVFEKNNVPMEKSPYTEILAAVRKSGDVKEGQTFFFTFSKGKMIFETNGKEQYVAKDLSDADQANLLKMWFGITADKGAEKLQKEMLGNDQKEKV